MMKDYKIIACDLDGTLVGTDLKLSHENYAAIKHLTHMGVHFVPATGRTLCEMEEIYKLPEVRYVIYSNGAAIYDKVTDENIFMGLGDVEARFAYSVIEKYDVLTVIHKDGKTYADRVKVQNIGDYNVNANVDYLVKNCCIQVDNFKDTFLSGGLESFSSFFRSAQDQEECLDALKANHQIRAVRGWHCNLEVFCKEAGKGSALKILADKLGIDMQDVISVGDSDNDKQMTTMAGLGLACANGCDSLKEVADKIICTNDEHVVSYVNKNYFDNN